MGATGFAVRPILGQPLRLDGDASTAAGVLARHIGWVMAVGLTPRSYGCAILVSWSIPCRYYSLRSFLYDTVDLFFNFDQYYLINQLVK